MKTTHYFNAPAGEGELQAHVYELLGERLSLLTSGGTFAKRGFDFGTKLLLETSVTQYLESGKSPRRALDLGCGNGVVALFLRRFFPQLEVVALDVSARAVEVAGLNIKKDRQITLLQADGIPAAYAEAAFDLILLNPPIRAGKDVCYRLYREAAAALVPNGVLDIVVRKQQGALSHAAELDRHFSQVDLLAKKKGYHVYRAIKGA